MVGVVEDVRYGGTEDEYPPMLYRAFSGGLAGNRYVARTSLDGSVLHDVIDELVRERVTSMAAAPPVPIRAAMSETLRDERARSRLALGAAAVALLLTVVGLYASMQHAVDVRRGELALRKAVGASDGRLIRMILKQAASIIGTGAILASLVPLLLTERIEGLLLGLDALSPAAWIATLALIAITGAGAACLPALRAGRVDPAVALRDE